MAIIFNEYSKKSSIEEKFEALCEKLLPPLGYGVYDLRYLSGSATLRVFLTKNDSVNGIDLNDCIKVDKMITPYIEEESWIPENFVLEVSSPGVYRDIRGLDQLKFSVGELIKVKFNSKAEEKELKNQVKIATLVEFDDTGMIVLLEDNNKKITIKYEMIKSVNAELKI